MASPADGALAPQELLSRLSEGAMALATGALAAESFDEHRAAAYSRACGLAESALHAAAGLAAQQEIQEEDLLAELADLADLGSTMSQRLTRLEEQQEVSHAGN